MLQICALASGSNGNCYYIGNNKEAVLIDMGISRRMLLRRLKEVNLDIKKVQAIFITHEHTDHIKGFKNVSEINFIPGYITRATLKGARKDFQPSMVKFFEPGEMIQIGDMKIHSHKRSHDAAEACGYRIEIDNKSVMVATDLGNYDEQTIDELNKSHAVFLETNYDETMLTEGKYPPFLKHRVASDHGHLSNKQAFELVASLTENAPLSTIFLSHISKDNNTLEKAMEAFNDVKGKYTIIPTSRYAPTEVIAL